MFENGSKMSVILSQPQRFNPKSESKMSIEENILKTSLLKENHIYQEHVIHFNRKIPYIYIYININISHNAFSIKHGAIH